MIRAWAVVALLLVASKLSEFGPAAGEHWVVVMAFIALPFFLVGLLVIAALTVAMSLWLLGKEIRDGEKEEG